MSIKTMVLALKKQSEHFARIAGLYEKDRELAELEQAKDTAEAEIKRIDAEAAVIGNLREIEGLNEGDSRLRRSESKALVFGDTFPPKDFDLREAVAALVRTAYPEQRKEALGIMRQTKLDEKRPHLDALHGHDAGGKHVKGIIEKIEARKFKLSQ